MSDSMVNTVLVDSEARLALGRLQVTDDSVWVPYIHGTVIWKVRYIYLYIQLHFSEWANDNYFQRNER